MTAGVVSFVTPAFKAIPVAYSPQAPPHHSPQPMKALQHCNCTYLYYALDMDPRHDCYRVGPIAKHCQRYVAAPSCTKRVAVDKRRSQCKEWAAVPSSTVLSSCHGLLIELGVGHFSYFSQLPERPRPPQPQPASDPVGRLTIRTFINMCEHEMVLSKAPILGKQALPFGRSCETRGY